MLRLLPLSLTGLRLLLGPAFLMVSFERPAVLAVIVGIAILTDWLDGLLARRLGVVSRAGKLLDPLADALFCMIVFVDFARHGLMAGWIVAILIAREAVVTFVLRPVALRKGVVVAASPLGKVKTVLQFAAILLVLATLAVPDMAHAGAVGVVTQALFYAVLGLSLASAGRYALRVRAALK